MEQHSRWRVTRPSSTRPPRVHGGVYRRRLGKHKNSSHVVAQCNRHAQVRRMKVVLAFASFAFLSIIMLPRPHAHPDCRGRCTCASVRFFLPLKEKKRQKEDESTLEQPHQPLVHVDAAPVAIHVQRLVAGVTVQPLRARISIGTRCTMIYTTAP